MNSLEILRINHDNANF